MIDEEKIISDTNIVESAYPTVKQEWGVIGLLIVITLGVGVPIGILQLAIGETLNGLMGFLGYVIPFVVLILITRAWWKKNPKNDGVLNFNNFPLIILPAVVLVTMAMLIINVEITSWVPAPEWLMELFKDMAQDNLLGFLTIAVAAPILEEILMRGIVFRWNAEEL